eukprot:IDg7558t1
MLKRLSFPSRWTDLEHIFGMRASALCEVFWEVVESFVEARKHLLEVFRSGLMGRRAEIYSAAIKERGAPLDNCVGFIDCTKIQMSRPGGSGAIQRSCFSGHKRFHCLVYQTVTTPDGLMFNLYGPEVGRRHDMTLYRESNLDAVLQEALLVDGRQYCIFGDSAYVLKPWLQTAFPRVGSTSAQEAYNTAMSMVREAVEWTYKDLKQIWTSQDFKRQLKVLQSPIALLYKSSALLWNFRTCLTRGGQRTKYSNHATTLLLFHRCAHNFQLHPLLIHLQSPRFVLQCAIRAHRFALISAFFEVEPVFLELESLLLHLVARRDVLAYNVLLLVIRLDRYCTPLSPLPDLGRLHQALIQLRPRISLRPPLLLPLVHGEHNVVEKLLALAPYLDNTRRSSVVADSEAMVRDDLFEP